jgi:hypothetical protein
MLTQQLTMEFAAARADVGVQRSAQSAERLTPGWIDKAAEMLRVGACILAHSNAEFTIEDLRALIDKALPQPPDLRAWGAATRQAVAKGFIERIPGRYAPAASSNRAPKPVYRKGPKA